MGIAYSETPTMNKVRWKSQIGSKLPSSQIFASDRALRIKARHE